MSRRTCVVFGFVECLQPNRGGCKLIDSHGADTVVCPFTTGRGIGTETCGMGNVFPADDLQFCLDTYDSCTIYIYIYICIYIYMCVCVCVFGSLISDVTLLCACWWVMGEVMACGSLHFSDTGCPIPDIDNLCLLCIDLCLGCCFYF